MTKRERRVRKRLRALRDTMLLLVGFWILSPVGVLMAIDDKEQRKHLPYSLTGCAVWAIVLYFAHPYLSR